MCTEKLYENFCRLDNSSRKMFGRDMAEHIAANWDIISERCSAKILQYDFVEINDRVFGSYCEMVETSFLYQLRLLNMMLMENAAKRKNIFLINLSDISNTMGRNSCP